MNKKGEYMEFDIDHIAHTNRLTDYNPFVKVVGSLILVLSALFISNNYYSVFIIILSSILLLAVARVSLKDYLKFLTIPFAFTFITCIFLLFFFPSGKYIWNSGFFVIGITTESLTISVLTFLRVFACFSSLGFMSLTTPINDVIQVLRRFYVPKIFCEIATLMYNAIFIFLDNLGVMRNAQKTRLGYLGSSMEAMKSYGAMFSNLFLLSLEKSETLQRSLESRCYTGELPVYKPDRSKDSYPELIN